MIADFHMHTNFSTDADVEVTQEKMIQGAITKGLQTMCITDHMDIDFSDDPNEFTFDTERYFSVLKPLQEKYRDVIDVRIGVETGLQPHLGEKLHHYVNQYAFDFVIGSVHLIKGEDPYSRKMFESVTDKEAYRQAFEETIINIQKNSDFDVLGHMDYVVRYGKNQAKEYFCKNYADYIDEILKKLIYSGKGIELNTGGLKYGLGFAHPHPEILKRYKELGGEIITVGSDAHQPQHIAYGFEAAKDILKENGFKYYTKFKDRKPIFEQVG